MKRRGLTVTELRCYRHRQIVETAAWTLLNLIPPDWGEARYCRSRKLQQKFGGMWPPWSWDKRRRRGALRRDDKFRVKANRRQLAVTCWTDLKTRWKTKITLRQFHFHSRWPKKCFLKNTPGTLLAKGRFRFFTTQLLRASIFSLHFIDF